MRGFNIEYLYSKIYELVTGDFTPDSALQYFNQTLLPILKIASVAVILVSLVGILYSLIRTRDIWKEANKSYAYKEPKDADFPENEKWQKVLNFLHSDNPADWRQSIIEADIILFSLVSRMGYQGETLGERLKGVERSDFITIDNAWEAHKVRNRIAHEGSDFVLTQREAERIIGLFESVLKEFGYLA
jgi:hypothetical protein